MQHHNQDDTPLLNSPFATTLSLNSQMKSFVDHRLTLSVGLALCCAGLLGSLSTAQPGAGSIRSAEVYLASNLAFPRLSAPSAPSAPATAGTPPRFLVSTTSDLTGTNGLPDLSDAGLPMVGGVDAPSPHFVDAHWQAMTGFVPTDVDAVTRVPGTAIGSSQSLAFSLLSNEGGVKDGDVVGFDGQGGLQAIVTEETLLSALGRDDADIDVDGIAYDDNALLLFSLQSDLSASVLGAIEDGDVFRLESNGSVTRIMTEDEVQTQFTLATGSSAAIGDVNGLEWNLGQLWVTTQGPSAWDGGVIDVGNAPSVVLDESQASLGGAELDGIAYTRPGDEVASLSFDRLTASEGDLIHADFVGTPNSAHVVLFSGATSVLATPQAAGWASLYLDPNDAWLATAVSDLGANFVQLDATGRLGLDYTLPSTAFYGLGFGAEEGWSFQMLDLGTLELSAPARIIRQ